jgi:hypothetical protein
VSKAAEAQEIGPSRLREAADPKRDASCRDRHFSPHCWCRFSYVFARNYGVELALLCLTR